MRFLDLLLTEFDHEMDKTRRILERVPEKNFDWKPHEKSMSLGRLASHVADIPARAASISRTEALVRSADFKPFLAASTQDLVGHFDSVRSESRTAITELTDDQLSIVWSVKFGDRTLLSLPRAMALREVCMDHMIHHRGQLSVYLRLLEVPVPGMYGPSADEAKLF